MLGKEETAVPVEGVEVDITDVQNSRSEQDIKQLKVAESHNASPSDAYPADKD